MLKGLQRTITQSSLLRTSSSSLRSSILELSPESSTFSGDRTPSGTVKEETPPDDGGASPPIHG